MSKEFDEVTEEIKDHVIKVGRCLEKITDELHMRACSHDDSKYGPLEFPIYSEYSPKMKLKENAFGTENYEKLRIGMKPALDHHFAHNRHHPEHFKNGIYDMNIIDLVEMLCDWKAASTKREDGDLIKSIDFCNGRYNLGIQLVSILKNSAHLFEEIK